MEPQQSQTPTDTTDSGLPSSPSPSGSESSPSPPPVDISPWLQVQQKQQRRIISSCEENASSWSDGDDDDSANGKWLVDFPIDPSVYSAAGRQGLGKEFGKLDRGMVWPQVDKKCPRVSHQSCLNTSGVFTSDDFASSPLQPGATGPIGRALLDGVGRMYTKMEEERALEAGKAFLKRNPGHPIVEKVLPDVLLDQCDSTTQLQY